MYTTAEGETDDGQDGHRDRRQDGHRDGRTTAGRQDGSYTVAQPPLSALPSLSRTAIPQAASKPPVLAPACLGVLGAYLGYCSPMFPLSPALLRMGSDLAAVRFLERALLVSVSPPRSFGA